MTGVVLRNRFHSQHVVRFVGVGIGVIEGHKTGQGGADREPDPQRVANVAGAVVEVEGAGGVEGISVVWLCDEVKPGRGSVPAS
jgi:hypothetical protein